MGGSSGIGYAVALASLQAAALNVIIASSNLAKVEKAVERLKAEAQDAAGSVKGIVIDASDLTGVEKSIKEVGTINHLVWTCGETIAIAGGVHINTVDVAKLKGP